jgi:hypothetical protein
MPFELDAGLLAEISAMLAAGARTLPQPAALDDWKTLRATVEAGLAALEAALPERPGGLPDELLGYIRRRRARDAALVCPARLRPRASRPGSCVSARRGDDRRDGGAARPLGCRLRGRLGRPRACGRLPPGSGVPAPLSVEDCYAGLAWLAGHAGQLSVDAARIAVMGDSGGGGLAAGAAVLARVADLAGLPAAYLEVGELDIFRDEVIEYARRAAAAGTPIELHVHSGCPHGFDRAAPNADVVRRARADRLRVLRSY